MAINVISLQHNGGFLPGTILFTQCYYHGGTRSNAMKRFCICSLRSHLKTVVNIVGGLLASRRVFSWLPLFFFCSYSTDSD